VLEGRDIGTVVFPDAEAKFFLTASAELRAERRYRELVARAIPCDLAAIGREVSERDRRDRHPGDRAPRPGSGCDAGGQLGAHRGRRS